MVARVSSALPRWRIERAPVAPWLGESGGGRIDWPACDPSLLLLHLVREISPAPKCALPWFTVLSSRFPLEPGCNLCALIGRRSTLTLTRPVNQAGIQRTTWLRKDQLESGHRWDRCRRNAGLVETDAT